MLYQAENPHGGDRYGRAVELDFSVNTNPLGTPPAVRRAAAAAAGRMDRYPDPYCRELTEAMARSEGVPREHILFGNGAAELIFTYCAALRPRRALELAPTFSEYAAALTAWGCQVDRLPLRREEGFVPGPDLLDRLRRERYDVLFLCNPNNPTGRLMDPALLREVLALCRERETRLFVDECFLDLSGGAETGSLKPFLAQYPGLFILKAFTKNYAMAGLRLGCGLTADGDLLTAMGRLSQPWNVSLPAQAAGLTALEEREFLERARQLIVRERSYLRRGLERLGLEVCPSQANYLLFYALSPLFQPLLDRGILIRDCANYPGLGPGWYRAAVKRRRENQALLAAIGEVLDALDTI